MSGKIIFLNGASSSGKSTIANELQKQLGAPYLRIGIDDALQMLPERFRDFDNSDNHKPLFQAISGVNHCVATLASVGNNIIVDHVILDGFKGYYLAECAFLLAHYPVLFVGLVCKLNELEKRERERGDRKAGLARSQYKRVHAHGIYDLTIDTSALTVQGCAEKIKIRLQQNTQNEAFNTIRDKFISR